MQTVTGTVVIWQKRNIACEKGYSIIIIWISCTMNTRESAEIIHYIYRFLFPATMPLGCPGDHSHNVNIDFILGVSFDGLSPLPVTVASEGL